MRNVFPFTTCRQCILLRKHLASRDYECADCTARRLAELDRKLTLETARILRGMDLDILKRMVILVAIFIVVMIVRSLLR
jgi:hypothetical protein